MHKSPIAIWNSIFKWICKLDSDFSYSFLSLSEFSSSLSVCCFKFAEVPNMQSTLNDMQQKKFDPPSNINENNLLTRGRFLLERKLEDKLLKALNNTQHIKNQL